MTARTRLRALLVAATLIAVLSMTVIAGTFSCGVFAIINVKNGKCLTVDGDNYLDNNATIYLEEYKGWEIQKWYVEEVAPLEYIIVSKPSGKALIVNYATEAQTGANIKQYDYQGHRRQRWNLLGHIQVGAFQIARVDRYALVVVPEVHTSGWTNAVQGKEDWLDEYTLNTEGLWYFRLIEPVSLP